MQPSPTTPLRAILLAALVWTLPAVAEDSATAPAGSAPPPNLILVLADDLGYGELGCYGQERIRTPCIDRMAAEGMRFTDYHAGSTVCAPSRCALLTGLHTGHAHIRANREIQPEGQEPIPAGTLTLARALRDLGYRTAYTGKWGLGGPGSSGAPETQGFDHSFGYLCQRQAHRYYPDHLWRDGERVELEGNREGGRAVYAHDLITADALDFLDRAAREGDRPFFLYVAYTIPHVDLDVPEDSLAEYEGAFPETPYDGSKGYCKHATPRAAYAAMISRLDRDVGRLLARLDALGLDGNTLVLFTSDNGPTYAGGVDFEFFASAGGLRGLKGSLYEGGLRVPMVARWPGRIAAGVESDLLSAAWDVFPTFVELAGGEPPGGLDGVSLAPTLLGAGERQRPHDHLLWELHEYGGQQAVRMGDWKAVRRGLSKDPGAPIALYDLAADLEESTDVAAEHPEVVARIEKILATDRADSKLWSFTRGTEER